MQRSVWVFENSGHNIDLLSEAPSPLPSPLWGEGRGEGLAFPLGRGLE